jgi:hypothetical protein
MVMVYKLLKFTVNELESMDKWILTLGMTEQFPTYIQALWTECLRFQVHL